MEMVVIKLYRQFSTPTQDEIALNPIQLTLPRLIFSALSSRITKFWRSLHQFSVSIMSCPSKLKRFSDQT